MYQTRQSQRIMPLLVLVLVLVAAVKGECTCDGNLVQTLKKCADAINDGEDLLAQMEKCAPDGCNYDCPSATKVDEQFKNLTTTLEKLQMTQETMMDIIVSHAVNITDVVNAVTSHTENITDIVNTVAKNALDIASNAAGIDTISGGYTVCGTTGWTRVAYLDMSDPSQNCPTEFRLVSANGVRSCGRKVSSNPSCNSKVFSTNDMTYFEVCGRALGYQYGSTDANGSNQDGHNDIDSYYLDGISITHGTPRQHIWTYMVGYSEVRSVDSDCPCNVGNNVGVQSFIGNDYYCESANPNSYSSLKLFTEDTIWDGKGCHNNEAPCCKHPNLPWFYKAFDTATDDDIEIRICGDESTSNEETPVSLYEVFVK